MKVLMFGWEFPPHISGGLGTACYGLTKGLSTLSDVDVIFVVPKVQGNEKKTRNRLIGAGEISITNRNIRFEELGKAISYFKVGSKMVPYVDPEDYWKQQSCKVEENTAFIETDSQGRVKFSGKYGPGLLSEIARYAMVAGIIAGENRFDIIHAHDWLTFPAGIMAKQVSGKPMVIHVHATDFDRSGGSANPEVYAIEKRGMEEADKIITVSNLTRQTVIDKYGIEPGKVITVYNAVEPVPVHKKNCHKKEKIDKIVTFLGRVTVQKGPDFFVDAAYMVLQKIKNVRFVMSGSGDMMDKVVTRIARLRIGDRFFFTGFLKGKDVFDMLRLSDVFVMPSVSEPFGITPLEAMQCGVPVIISKQSGVSEILSNAIKVDFWDTHALADAIYGMIQYPVLHKMFAVNGKKEVKAIKWVNSAQKVREVYKLALSA